MPTDYLDLDEPAPTRSPGYRYYCPTCGKGWDKLDKRELEPRECFRCRHHGMSPEQLMIEERRERERASSEQLREELKERFLPKHESPVLSKRTFADLSKGRNLRIWNPRDCLEYMQRMLSRSRAPSQSDRDLTGVEP